MIQSEVYLPALPNHDALRPLSRNTGSRMDIFYVVTFRLRREPSLPVTEDISIVAMWKFFAPSNPIQGGLQVNNVVT